VPRFLADSSIWGWANSGKRPDIAEKLADRFERDEIVTCPPVVLEVLHRARSGGEYEELFAALFEPLALIPLGEQQSARAIEVQRELAQVTHGNHLRPAVDFLIAAAAEAAGEDIVLWSFDKDVRVICTHTGQPHEAEASSRRRS
jgi:predicted nucleic acid-binding protein